MRAERDTTIIFAAVARQIFTVAGRRQTALEWLLEQEQRPASLANRFMLYLTQAETKITPFLGSLLLHDLLLFPYLWATVRALVPCSQEEYDEQIGELVTYLSQCDAEAEEKIIPPVFAAEMGKFDAYFLPTRPRREAGNHSARQFEAGCLPPSAILPPYLLFLNDVFMELGADRIEAIKKAELEELIRERWPVGQFGTPSNNLITPMATILRSLDAKRGGAKRQQRTVH